MKYTEKLLISIFCLIFFSINIQAQNNKVDSLKNELKFHKEKDTIRVKLLIDVARLYLKSDLDKANEYLDESIALSKAIDYKMGTARSLANKAYGTVLHSNFNDGDQYYIEAISIYKSINAMSKAAFSYSNLGMVYTRRGDFNNAIKYYGKAVELKKELGKSIIKDLYFKGRAYIKIGDFKNGIIYYKKALHISEQTKNTKQIGNCLSGIGNVYSHQGNYPLALDYLNKSLAIAKKHEHTKNISNALLSIGNVYIRLQNYDKAIAFHEKALIETKKETNSNLASISHNLGESYKYKKNYKKALDYFDKAIEVFRKRNNKADVGITLNKIGETYFEQGKVKAALQYFKEAININSSVDNQRGLAGSYLGLAKVFYNQKDYVLALENALNCKKKAANLQLKDVQRDVVQILSNIYERTGQYRKAYANHQQYKILNDSLFNKKNIEKIAQIEYEYKYKKALDSASIRELKLTKTVKAVNQNLEKSQRNLFLGIIAFLALGFVLVAIIFFLKLRHEKSKAQNIAIEQKLLRSQMTPHFIFNSLSVLQGMILNKEDKKSIFYLSKFSKLLRLTLENSRDKLVPLHHELEAAKNYLELQNLEEDEAYQYTILVDDTMDEALFKIPPMLIQPFIENAIEHAFQHQKENKKIDVQLKFLNKELICTITDNGIGIDAQKEEKNKNKKSLATTITTERIKALSKDFKVKGSVSIEDRQKYNEKGTVVTLVIPYKLEKVA